MGCHELYDFALQISCPYESRWESPRKRFSEPLSSHCFDAEVHLLGLIPLLHPRSVPWRFQCVQESGLSHLPLRAVKFMTSGLSSAQPCPWKPLSPACLLLREEYSHSSLGQMCMSEYCSHVLEPHQVEIFLSGNTCTKPPEHHSSASPAGNMLRTHSSLRICTAA